jgi:GGDEF domain-containing protein
MSLRIFNRSGATTTVQAYQHAVRLIVDAATPDGPAGDESDLAELRESISAAKKDLVHEEPKAPDVLVAAGAASAAIQKYQRKVVSALRSRSVEIQAVVGMLTETMAEVGAGSERSLERLREIERQLARSQETFDVRELRQQMAACLEKVREESGCRKREAEQAMGELRAALGENGHKPEQQRIFLPLDDTGNIAVAIERAAATCSALFVAVLTIDHLKPVGLRFGPEAVSRLVAYCAEQARESLRGVQEVMIWNGSACVALLDGAAGAQSLERSVMHEAQQRRALTLTLGHREVILQAAYSKACVLPASGRPAASVVESMKAFLAEVARPSF